MKATISRCTRVGILHRPHHHLLPPKNSSPPTPVNKPTDPNTTKKVVTAGVGAGTMDESDVVVGAAVLTVIGLINPLVLLGVVIVGAVVIISAVPSDSSVLLDETINNLNEHPEDWELVGEPETVPAMGKKNQGGKSTEETYWNRNTGQEVERHTLRDKNGNIIDQHWRLP